MQQAIPMLLKDVEAIVADNVKTAALEVRLCVANHV
jgi:hypothetical protein